MANPPRILVIEDEYLIAMDAERILSEAIACTVVLSTRKEFANVIADDLFQIVLLDTGPSLDTLGEDLARIARTGAAVIVTTSDGDLLSDRMPHDHAAFVLTKPYDDDQLVGVVVNTLSGAGR